MEFVERLSLGLGKKLPLILQTESTECGLACLGMVAGYHGYHTDLATLRRQYQVSLKGATLSHIVQIAGRMNLGARPLRVELEELNQLKLPCILHWNFNHFVVLKELKGATAVIYDPATGMRKLSLTEVSAAFTGVALEIWPGTEFKPQEEKLSIKLRQLTGKVTGLYRSFGQILLLAVALEVFTIVSPFFLQWVIDHVLLSADRSLLTTLAIGFGLLMLIRQTVTAIRAWVILHMSTTLNIQWRANVFTHLLRLPVQYFEKRHLGDIVSRFGSLDKIQQTLTTSFLEGILDGVMSIVILIVMFVYSPLLGWVAVGAMVLYALGRWAWYAPFKNATMEQIIHAAKQQSHFLETVRGVKAIKLFQRYDDRRSSWLNLVVNQINASVKTQKYQIFYGLLNGLLFGIENILIIWLGANLVLDGEFSVGMLMAFYSYKEQFGGRVTSLIDKVVDVIMLQLQGERLADIVLSEPELKSDNLVTLNAKNFTPELIIRGLRYRYSEQEPMVLDGFDLTIPPGQSIAVAGPSGCGKSTLIKVLLGILPATEGEVLVGNIDLRHAGSDSLRSVVGTVLQDDELFAGSIGENICFFSAEPDQEWVEKCARMAAIDAEIKAMPMQYNTLIGDMGTVLSGGQKQRVLLARALYKKPKILFLDEATSHLDIAKEQEVNTSIKSLNITRIIVAHRPETIASADRVIVMHGGRIVQDEFIDPQPGNAAMATA